MSDLTGQLLGKFRLIQQLGSGGYARVYKAEHIHLKTQVAIKIREAQVITQEDQDNFKSEAQLLASLKHPNIVQVTDFDVIDYRAFLVLEYAPYGTPRLINGVPLSPLLVASYIKQIAGALQYIHDDGRKLVHCDIKPANMLLWENNLIKLSDFGITQRDRDSKALTLEQLAGTALYMAPEHWNGKPVPASDQYSLAVVAYEWLSGDLPFQGSALDLQRQHMYSNPPPLHRRNPAISMAVEQVINRALQKNHRDRYPRVIDFATALENALKNMARSTVRPPAPRTQPENTLPPLPPLLLREQQQHPGTAPQQPRVPHSNPMVLGSPTSDGFQAHFDPTMQMQEPFVPETPPEEPELPPHELVLEQRKLVQYFVEIAQEQLAHKNAIIQQRSTARHTSAERRRQDLDKTDDDVEHVRRYTTDMKRQAKQQGWYGLAEKFDKAPFAIGTRSSLTLQISDYRHEAEVDRDVITAFLKRYSDPEHLLTTSLKVGGACAILLAVFWGVVVTSLHGWSAFTGTSLLVMPLLLGTIAAGMFGYTNIARLGTTFHHLKQLARRTEETQQARRERIEAEYQQRLDTVEQEFQQAVNRFMRELHQQLSTHQAEVDEFGKKLGLAALAWNDPRWQERWQGRRNAPNGNATALPAPPVISIGQQAITITPELPSLPPIPLVLSCPNGCNLLLEASGPAKGAAISASLAAVLRLLLAQQPGSVHFTFVDPVRYGRNFEPFLWLAEQDILMTGSVLASSSQIEQQLADLTGHIMRITQQRIRNAQAHVEPYRVLVVMDFPANFSAAAARNLLDIARNGPRCGISTIVVVDEARSLQTLQDFEISALEQLATVIRSNGQSFALQSDETQNSRLELDRMPEESLYQPLLQSLKQSLHSSSSMEQHPLLQEVFARPAWLARPSEAKVWLGYASTTREPITFSFNRQSGSNLLIVGKRGETNTGLLLSAMMLLAAQQSPRMAQFYVLDLSTGTMGEMLGAGNGNQLFEYVKQLLPNYTLQVVHRHNVRDALPAFVAALNAEIQHRIRSESVEKSSLYLFICGLERISDLGQVNVAADDGRAVKSVTKLLSQILRNGSDFGIHTLAWCSTHDNFVDVLNERVLAQFDNRVIFPSSSREEMQALLDRTDIPEIGSGQALFFSRDELRLEKFRPFPPPSKTWLQEVAQNIQHKR